MALDFYDDIRYDVRERDSATIRLGRIINSAMLFVLAYVITHFAQNLLLGLGATISGFDVFVTYSSVFGLSTDWEDWSKLKIGLTFGLGPVVLFILGLLLLRLYFARPAIGTLFKPFLLWLSLHMVILFLSYSFSSTFGAGYPASLFYFGIAVIASWVHLPPELMAGVSLLAFVLMVGLGIIVSQAFITLSFSAKLAYNVKGRQYIVNQFFILPWLLGSMSVLGFHVAFNYFIIDSPRMIFISLVELSCFFPVLLGILFKIRYNFPELKIYKRDVLRTKPYQVLILGLVLGIVLLGIMLSQLSGMR